MKKYKVTIKVKYETTMLREQVNAKQAKADVVKVIGNILKQNNTLKSIFEKPPYIVCEAKVENDRR